MKYTQLFRQKPIGMLDREEEAHGPSLQRTLGVKDLTFLGVAAVIGAGIFSTIGNAAYNGGPGVIFLFILTAIACGFTAMCYAEFASRVPVSGSAYTYSYVTFGEIIAWIIGWALILEYAIGNIVVAISWSAYFNNILQAVNIHLPEWLLVGYQPAKLAYERALAEGASVDGMAYASAPVLLGIRVLANLPALVIVVLVTWLAMIGIRESKNSANAMVWLKIVILVFVAVVGLGYIFSNGTTDNWSPFLPNGMTGVLRGVSAVFFAYIGFDAISTTAEECKNPQRDLPRGMMYSLIICTVIYVITTLVITGMVNYSEFAGVTDPIAFVFEKLNMERIGFLVSVSAVVAATSVLLVFQLGQPRIWMSMSRDGLLPKRFASIHPKYKTPGFSTIVTGFLVGIPVIFIDDLLVTDLTSIGTLFAFFLVCGGVLLLPKIEKEPGKFSLPFISGKYIVPTLVLVILFFSKTRAAAAVANIGHEGYQELLFLIFLILAVGMAILSFMRNYSLIPVLGLLSCAYLMIEIPAKSWLVFFGWMGIGLGIYFLYSFRNSRLATHA